MKNKNSIGSIKIFIILLICLGPIVFLATILNSWVFSILSTLIVSLIATLIINKLLNKTLEQILYFIKSMNKNDLMIKIDERLKNSDNEILKEINTMFEETKSNFKRQVNIATKILAVSEQIGSISDETQSAMEIVAASAETTSQSSERQFVMLNNVSEKTRDIVNTLNEINVEMEGTAVFTTESIKGVQLGIQDINGVKEKVMITRDSVKSTATNVDKLRIYSEDVVKMIDLINTIAEQTNMLALNASIEAARAGEHGKGFAVVATEVSKLSKETSEASAKIEEVISTLKEEILNISKSMEEETIHVEEEYNAIEKAINNFSKIQNSLEESVKKINTMSKNINNISIKSNEVEESVCEVTEFSKEINSEMQETSAQTILQNEKMISLNKIIEDLKNTADEMQQYVTSRVMEGKMLKDVEYILNTAKGKDVDNSLMSTMLKETGVDVIYITDNKGEIRYCNEKESIGLNLYKIDSTYDYLRTRAKPYITTPIKRRVEDNQLFKFLAMIDESGIIYQVGLSIDSLLKF